MEVLHKLFDAERWMDGKLINVADQIRAWRTDFFCKINRRGATFIRYLRVVYGRPLMLLIEKFHISTIVVKSIYPVESGNGKQIPDKYSYGSIKAHSQNESTFNVYVDSICNIFVSIFNSSLFFRE